MKNLRQLCAAVMLILALSLSAFADGHMHTTIADPPPPSADGQITTMVAGQISTGVEGQIETTLDGQMETTNSVAHPVDPVMQMTLSVLHSILSLF